MLLFHVQHAVLECALLKALQMHTHSCQRSSCPVCHPSLRAYS